MLSDRLIDIPGLDHTPDPDGLRLLPLGGLGEIGMNLMALEYRDEIILIDCGLMFPEPYMLGVDIVIPEIGALLPDKQHLKALILTHGHEDHIGALPFILPRLEVPVYGTELTTAMVRRRLDEHGLEDLCELNILAPGESFASRHFEIEFIPVAHSIPDGVALAITTPAGLVVHSGDFKIDHNPLDGVRTDLNRLAELGSQGVELLLADSTNVENPGFSGSETEVSRAFAEHLRAAPGRVIATLFSSNLNRVRELCRLARDNGRKAALLGRSLLNNVRIARELGRFRRPGDGGEIDNLINIEEVSLYPSKELLIITTGSQGEPFSGLSLIASNQSKWIRIEDDDTVIFSSRFIPGNEKAISSLINRLIRQGARVLYHPIAFTHVSGHACRQELELLLDLLHPRHFIPIHGEFRHLDLHARLAVEQGVERTRSLVVSDGELIELNRNGLTRLGRVEHGKVLIDGKGVGEIDFATLHDRRHLSHNGMVLIVVGINEATGEIVYGPELTTRGVVSEESEKIIDQAQQLARETLTAIPAAERCDWLELKTTLRRCLKRYFRTTLEKRPIILPIIIEL